MSASRGVTRRFQEQDGFILPACFYLFRFLGKLSLFNFIRYLSRIWWSTTHGVPLRDCTHNEQWGASRPFPYRYAFPEAWATGNLVASICAGLFAYALDNTVLQIILLAYAVERTIELFVYQVNVLLFDPIAAPVGKYKIKSATRTIILLIMNMIEYTFWFSCIYSCLGLLLDGYSSEGFVFVLESFNTFTNLSTPADISLEHFQTLAFIETLLGMFMNLICLGRFIGMLPSVQTIDGN